MKVKNAGGLEQLTTRQFAKQAKLLASTMEDLKFYNDLTGVSSPLLDLNINTGDEDQNLFDIMLDFLPIMSKLAEEYHYYKIERCTRGINLMRRTDDEILLIHVDDEGNEIILEQHFIREIDENSWKVTIPGICPSCGEVMYVTHNIADQPIYICDDCDIEIPWREDG